MFNGKYVSINRVVENILRDTEYYNEMYISDAIEWAARAMDLIGVYTPFTTTIDTVEITNYRAALPAGLINLIAVRDHKTRHTYIASTDEYLMQLYNETQDATQDSHDPVSAVNETKAGVKPAIMPAYKVVNGYIFCNIKSGYVDVKYTKYPTDENGCLIIPAEERYLMGIEAYIIHKIDKKLYRRGLISRNIMQESEQDWLWYVNSAASKLVTPNYDEAETLKNAFLKLRTDSNAHDYGFSEMNKPTVNNF